MSTDLHGSDDATDLARPPADPAVLDSAVRFLNRALHASGLQLAVQVSAYVVDTFFAGDFAGLSSKDPHKTASFAALCAREDLQMGQATLYRLVRIGHQARHLPSDLAESLSISHHRALLALDNPQHKQHVARLAMQQGWTVEELEANIRAEHPLPGKPRGRPALAPVVKWLGAVQRAAGPGVPAPDFAAEFAALPAPEQAKLRLDLVALRKQIQRLEVAIGPG